MTWTNTSYSTVCSASHPPPQVRLPPEVNRALFVRNLPFKITPEEMYDIFGKYGAIRQIRVGNANDTKGTAFVVYEDIFDAKTAYEHLQGFNIMGRYLIVLYYQPNKVTKKMNLAKKEEELNELKARYGISEDD
ncbi:Splicing factor 3B subunit 6 [Mortierella claussenii]|nr:Splicing factor 3B subunit 6 [Mortierella claussenii]